MESDLMPLDRMNMFWNQQAMPQRNQFFQPAVAPGQFSGGTPTWMLNQSQRVPSTMGGQGSLPIPPGYSRNMNMNGPGSGLGGGMPRHQGNLGGNLGLGAGPQNAGGQGYATPGYPPQGFRQLQQYPQPQLPLPQGYPPQGYSPQGYNQDYRGQMPLQHAWEEPKKGGLKGFISNLMAKRKR